MASYVDLKYQVRYAPQSFLEAKTKLVLVRASKHQRPDKSAPITVAGDTAAATNKQYVAMHDLICSAQVEGREPGTCPMWRTRTVRFLIWQQGSSKTLPSFPLVTWEGKRKPVPKVCRREAFFLH